MCIHGLLYAYTNCNVQSKSNDFQVIQIICGFRLFTVTWVNRWTIASEMCKRPNPARAAINRKSLMIISILVMAAAFSRFQDLMSSV